MPDQDQGYVSDRSPHGGTPLGSVAGIEPAVVQRLAELGIVDVEQLRGMASIEGVREELATLFSEAGGDLDQTFEGASADLFAAASVAPLPLAPLGALAVTDDVQLEIDSQIELTAALAAEPVALPGSVNHISLMPPVRSQGGRGTCVAFAMTAVHEFYRKVTGNPQDFSEQFLYHETKKIDGASASCGTWQVKAAQVLTGTGEARESVWAYNPNPPCNNNGTEPANALSDAAAFKIQTVVLNANDVSAIKAALANNSCVGISVRVYNSWYQNAATYRTGAITMRVGNEPDVGGHAVCLVGYQDDPNAPGGGVFILRNSWGAQFGTACPYGVGYGTIPYAYPRTEAVTVPPAVAPVPSGRAVPLYRYWNPQIGDHFYTTNWGELGGGAHGWGYEGIQCYVLPKQQPLTVPLYRYWNGAAGDHFYTTNWGELGGGAYGWAYEGIQCYVYTQANPPSSLEGASGADIGTPPTGDCLDADVPGSFDALAGPGGSSFEVGDPAQGRSIDFASKAAASAEAQPSTDFAAAAQARNAGVNVTINTGG